MDLVVGVDAGGTASRAVVATLTGQIIGRGSAGPGNPLSAGPAAPAALGSAIRTALGGQHPADVVGSVIGMAGMSILAEPTMATAFEHEWAAIGLTCPMWTPGDAVTAFAAGTPRSSGAVLISGTGAIAALVDSWRIVRTVDGLGWLLGDEGSGLWLGLQAVRAVARSWSKRPFRPPPALAEKVARHARVATPDELVHWASRQPMAEIAALAPVVCAETRAGDPEAGRIVDEAVSRLAATLDELDAPAGPVVLAGALLSGDTPVRDGMLDLLRRRGAVVGTGRDPAAGAAWLAARLAGDIEDPAAERLHAIMLSSAAG